LATAAVQEAAILYASMPLCLYACGYNLTYEKGLSQQGRSLDDFPFLA